jgi:hypothetical protein
MHHSRLLPSILVVILAAACGGREETREEVEASIVSREESAAPTPAEDASLTAGEALSAEDVAALVDEDSALDAENRREFERRRASMGSFADCMRDVENLPDAAARARIEAACRARRAGP